jgi:hypothetical protein
MFVPAPMAATLASAINAFEGSVTRPVNVAFVDWPSRAEANEISARVKAERRRTAQPLGGCSLR